MSLKPERRSLRGDFTRAPRVAWLRLGARLELPRSRDLVMLLGAGVLGAGCSAQNHAVQSTIQVSADAPAADAQEQTSERQVPPGGAWWRAAEACPQGATLRTRPAEAEDGGGYRCELDTGVAHGRSSSWWPSDKLREHGRYVSGAKEGSWTRYAETGELLAREYYRADELSGRAQRYAAGVLVEDASYLHGGLSGVRIRYYANGALEERATYVAGVLSGEFESRDQDGGLSARGRYQAGMQDGDWEICGDTECTRARFQDGAQAGIWEVRDRAGVMLRSEDYSVTDQLTRIDYCQGHPCKRTVFVRR